MEAGMSTCYTYKQPFEYAWDGLQSMRKCITVGPGYITKNLNLGISVTKKYNASSLHSGPQCKQFCEHLHNCWKYFRNYFSRSWLEYGLYHVPLSGSQMLLSCLCRRLNAGRHHICIIQPLIEAKRTSLGGHSRTSGEWRGCVRRAFRKFGMAQWGDSLLVRDWRRGVVGFASVELMPVRGIDVVPKWRLYTPKRLKLQLDIRPSTIPP